MKRFILNFVVTFVTMMLVRESVEITKENGKDFVYALMIVAAAIAVPVVNNTIRGIKNFGKGN